MDPKSILTQIAKGAIAPTDLSVGGVLEPDVARRFIDLLVDKSAFLKAITVQRTSKTEGYFKLLDIADQVLVRVAEGSDPSAGQLAEPTRTDVPYANKYTQLFYQLLFSAIDDNKDNPNFESDLENMFATKFSNELSLLGFVGVDDDYAASAFDHLNEGWMAKAEADAPLAQQVNTAGMTTVKEYLDACIAAMPDTYKMAGQTTFIISRSDWETFCDELGAGASSVMAQILLDGKLPQYKGYPLMPVSQQSAGQVIFTNPKNLIMTMLTEIKRFREVRGTKRCIDYTFDLASDFIVGNPYAVVVAWDQGY
jgi:hypothetical protein